VGWSSDNWITRGAAPFCGDIVAYDTYGDGLTQHAGAYVAQFHDTTDICLSVTQPVLDDPRNETWRKLDSFLFRRSDSQTTGGAGLHKPGKRGIRIQPRTAANADCSEALIAWRCA